MSMHQRTLLTTLPSGFLPHNRNFRPKTCQWTKEPFLLPFPSIFLPHNRNYRPKTSQCTKEPFLLPTLPSGFLPHNRNFRPKTCQCTKEPFLLPFPSVFLRRNWNYTSDQKQVNAQHLLGLPFAPVFPHSCN